MQWNFKVGEELFTLKHVVSDDSRVVTKMGNHRILVTFDSRFSLQVYYYNPELKKRVRGGIMRSSNCDGIDKWTYVEFPQETLELEPVDNWDWKALQKSEIKVAQHLIEKFKLNELKDPVILGDGDSLPKRGYFNIWTNQP